MVRNLSHRRRDRCTQAHFKIIDDRIRVVSGAPPGETAEHHSPFGIRLLGPMELEGAGRRSEIGPPRLRGVLAVLAADAGRPVMLESLVDRVWGESPPSRARHAVQVYVSQLRTILATAGGEQKVWLPR